MGIGFVLVIWAVIGAFLAGVGTLILGGLTSFLTRGAEEGRRRVILVARVFPFACLGWAALMFIFQAFVNGALLHRDPGLGDSWNCPLPNGYAITMIDVTDQGWVYNPRTQSGDLIAGKEDAVGGVRILQVAGKYILGGSDTHASSKREQESNDVDEYFLLDTQTGKRTDFASYDAMHNAASHLGIQTKLERIDAVYSRYRFTWFDVLVGFLLCIPPLSYALLLTRRIVKMRRTRQVSLLAST